MREFPNSPDGLVSFLGWVKSLESVQVAVEGSTQTFFAPWLTRIMAEGIAVVAVPTQRVVE